MVAAAKRVESAARRLYPFTRIIRLDRENLATHCPRLTAKYPEQLSEKLPAFGYAVGKQGHFQFQATFFMLYGVTGLEIALRVFQAVYNNFSIVDPTILNSNESTNLELPKCEQSLLSLAIKSQGRIVEMAVPPAGNRGFKSKIRGALEPVWVSRNRTGTTIIPA